MLDYNYDLRDEALRDLLKNIESNDAKGKTYKIQFKSKKDEIIKFYRDIQNQKNQINSAMFISLNNVNLIQGKKLLHFEIKYNIPIIMITNGFNNPDNIKFAISIIQYLIENKFIYNTQQNRQGETIEQKEEQLKFVVMAINQIYAQIQTQKTFIHQDLNHVQKLHDSIKKRESELFNIEIIAKDIFQRFPQIAIQCIQDEIQPAGVKLPFRFKNKYVEEIVNAIVKHIKDNNIEDFKSSQINTKFIKTLTSEQNIRNAGGIKIIQQQFEQFKN
jgi:hypothetical protein